MDREAWHAAIHGVAKSWTRLSNWTELKKNTFESVPIRWMKLEPIIQSEVSQKEKHQYSINQFSSVAQLCPGLWDPMNHSTTGLPVHHQLPEFTQTCVHWVSDVIQLSHPLSSSSPPAPNSSQHQSLFQWVNSTHQVAKVLEFQLQYQSFQWTPRTDLL